MPLTRPSRLTFAHLVARADRLPVPLTRDEVAHWLWPRLQRCFPLALGCVLMPNHLQLVTPAQCADAARGTLARLLGGLARSGGVRAGIRFEPIPPVLLQDDPTTIARQTRYVALNPLRRALVKDPLSWEWSTHSDVVGAVARPWITASRLAAAQGRSADGFARSWHRYVAREDDAESGAVTSPSPAAPTAFAASAIEDVARPVARSLRAHASDVRRRGPVRDLFLVVAPLVGWDRPALLASYCDVTTRAVQKSFHRAPPVAIEAAVLCLGDSRLRGAPQGREPYNRDR